MLLQYVIDLNNYQFLITTRQNRKYKRNYYMECIFIIRRWILKIWNINIMIDQQQENNNGNRLPILNYKQAIIQSILNNSVTIVCGETGSGKTTQVPQFIYPYFKKIIISQPRRISAITLAERVAEEMNVIVGKQVGYNVRFQQKKSQLTKIVFVTDGMAIRQLMMGISYDVFILDEAHERSINTDVLMAVLRKRLQIISKNGKNQRLFKLVIMSATIEARKFMQFFGSDSVINVQGRSYPTEVYNLLQPVQDYQETTFNTVMQIHYKEAKGDVLAFLTGQDQILSLHRRLQKTIEQHHIINLKILILYSAIPHEYQHQIFEKHDSAERRIILATNIAETSVTIAGVRYVVDCGFMKIRTYDNLKLLDMLTVVPISKANAMQRAGRAGRQGPGKCFRLYLKNGYDDLKPQISPEILRSQLSGPILQLKAVGVPAIRELQFMDQPPKQTIDECLRILREIKCLSDEPKQQITEYGREVSQIPLPPRLGHLLLLSLQFKCQGLMLSMLSVLSVDNLFLSTAVSEKGNKRTNLHEVLTRYQPVIKSKSSQNIRNASSTCLLTSDHLAKISILHEYVNVQNKQIFCKQNFINKNNIKRAVLIREQLEQYLINIVQKRKKKQFFVIGKNADQNKTHIKQTKIDDPSVQQWLKCMAKGCSYNTAKLTKQGKYSIMGSGQIAQIHPESICFYLTTKPNFIVFSQVVKTNKIYLKDITPLPDN